MAIFMEMRPVEEIKKKLKDAKNIAIIGCSACMNRSLAIMSKTGVFEELDKESGKYVPRAMLDKISELRENFIGEGKSVVSAVMSGCNPCGPYLDVVNNLATNEDILASDVIVCLSCPGGLFGLKKLFPKHRIVLATKPPLGVIYGPLELTDGGRFKRVVLESVSVVRFSRVDIE